MTPGCPAPTHRSDYSIRQGCICPEARDRASARRRQIEPRGHLRHSPRDRSPELSDVDVYLAKTGRAAEVSIVARAEAAAELTRAGLSAREIARRLLVSRRTVVRYRGRAAA